VQVQGRRVREYDTRAMPPTSNRHSRLPAGPGGRGGDIERRDNLARIPFKFQAPSHTPSAPPSAQKFVPGGVLMPGATSTDEIDGVNRPVGTVSKILARAEPGGKANAAPVPMALSAAHTRQQLPRQQTKRLKWKQAQQQHTSALRDLMASTDDTQKPRWSRTHQLNGGGGRSNKRPSPLVAAADPATR
jgi:hypothetical protein